MRARELAKITGGRWLNLKEDFKLGPAFCDSREITEGAIFVALKDKRDGHDFVEEAFAKGALAAIVSKEISLGPCLLVENTEKALQAWAKAYRQSLPAKVIAVVGSVGKTTAKEIFYQILKSQNKVKKSPRSYNNHLGVPMTLLSVKEDDEIVILEMGANGPGDLDLLGDIAKPDHLFVLPIVEAHLEGFNDLKGVREAKSEILNHLKQDALVMWPQDPELHSAWAYSGKSYSYGLKGQADFYPEENTVQFPNTHITMDNVRLKIPMPALYLAGMLSGIKALCDLLKINYSLVAMNSFSPAGGRLEVLQDKKITIINDAYNASPTSVLHAMKILSQASGRRVMVFGDMLEMGDNSEEAHRKVGELAFEHCDLLFCVGELANKACEVFAGKSQSFSSADDCKTYLKDHLQEGDTILVKASNAIDLSTMAGDLMHRRVSA